MVRHELVTDAADLCVHDETLEIKMCETEDSHGGGVVAAAGFEADETVFDNVDTTDAVGETELVERGEELNGVGVGLFGGDNLDGDALVEVDGDVSGLVGGVHGAVGHGPHVVGRGDVGVLKNACVDMSVALELEVDIWQVHTSLVRAVSQVGIHAPRLRLGRRNGNTMLLSIIQQILPSLEPIAELWHPPRCNDLDRRLEGIEGQLESNLVVSFASASMGHELAVLLLGNLDLCASDNGPG